MRLPEHVNNWLQQFESRERRLILVAAVFIFFAALYGFALEPLYDSHQSLQRQVFAKQELLDWMSQNASTLQQLKSARPDSTQNGSMLANIDAAARATGLANAVQRVEQDGETRVRVSLESAAFDSLVEWLSTLDRSYGIKPVQARVDRASDDGLVNASLTLSNPD